MDDLSAAPTTIILSPEANHALRLALSSALTTFVSELRRVVVIAKEGRPFTGPELDALVGRLASAWDHADAGCREALKAGLANSDAICRLIERTDVTAALVAATTAVSPISLLQD